MPGNVVDKARLSLRTRFETSSGTLQAMERDRLRWLRERIRAIERRSGAEPSAHIAKRDLETGVATAWTLGELALDAAIGRRGLDPGGVHEIKPADAREDADGEAVSADWMAVSMAARKFALALAVRRLCTSSETQRDAPVLWCASSTHAAELGTPYGLGCSALGLDLGRLIVVEPVKAIDVLWAIEEGLKSSGLALVIGQINDVELTPARRLALAAARSRTPCLLLTHPQMAAVAATATRWRVTPAASAQHQLDPAAPGASRCILTLERCRGRSAAQLGIPHMLEWCDVAYRFRLASGLADRAAAPRRAGSSLGWKSEAAGSRI